MTGIARFAGALSAVTAATAWCALALQLVLLLRATWDTKGPLLATIQFFSYFTILSNLAVALVATFALVRGGGAIGRFFRSTRVRGAVALYIAVTGAIYLAILSALWAPTGLQWLADTALHYAVPLLYLVGWVACEPRFALAWSDTLRWLAFPIAYFAWALARGAWLGEYPYPFLDVGALGYGRVVLNAIGVLGVFVVVGLVLVAINRRGAIGRAQRAG